jgi:hypothetical protein
LHSADNAQRTLGNSSHGSHWFSTHQQEEEEEEE